MTSLAAPSFSPPLAPSGSPRFQARRTGGNPGFFNGFLADANAAANPTDVFALAGQGYDRVAFVEAVTVWAVADTDAKVQFQIQRSVNGGGGTFDTAVSFVGRSDLRSQFPSFAVYRYTANRTSNGNGVDSLRQRIGGGSLTCNGAPVRVEFAAPIALRDLTEWLVVNLAGAAMPMGFKMGCYFEWSEEAVPPVMFAGDSTTSNANFMFNRLYQSGVLPQQCSPLNAGSNGYRMIDALLNTNGIPYPLVGGNGIIDRLGSTPGVVVLCYGINDLRQGAVTRAELISMYDAAIHAILHGTTSGQTYTSPVGAGTTFTWPATNPARPDTQIILWGANSLTLDGNASNFVTLTGRFAAMTLAQAAQTITDDLYEAPQFFSTDPRLFKVVQQQDIFGRVCATVANSGVWAKFVGKTKTDAPLATDILHPNARGQALKAAQIAPVVLAAAQRARSLVAFGL